MIRNLEIGPFVEGVTFKSFFDTYLLFRKTQ
jgi:hypothetical protein